MSDPVNPFVLILMIYAGTHDSASTITPKMMSTARFDSWKSCNEAKTAQFQVYESISEQNRKNHSSESYGLVAECYSAK